VAELVWWLCKRCLSVVLAVFIGIFMALSVALIFPNAWIPIAIEKYIEHKTKFPVHIGDSKCNLFKGHFEFHDISVTNAVNHYSIDHALSIQDLELDIKPSSLWHKNEEITFSKIFLDIDDITIIRNAKGKINLVELFEGLSHTRKDTPDLSFPPKVKNNNGKLSFVSSSHTVQPKSSSSARKWRIGQLTLHLDSLYWKDFKQDSSEKSLELFYRHQWTQVTSLREITDVISTDLQPYGMSLFIQSIFDTLLNFSGVSRINESINALQSLGKRVLSGVKGEIQSHFTEITTEDNKQ
jgi:hypothetical protein